MRPARSGIVFPAEVFVLMAHKSLTARAGDGTAMPGLGTEVFDLHPRAQTIHTSLLAEAIEPYHLARAGRLVGTLVAR
jgi:hypothetical protein